MLSFSLGPAAGKENVHIFFCLLIDMIKTFAMNRCACTPGITLAYTLFDKPKKGGGGILLAEVCIYCSKSQERRLKNG